MPDSNSEPSMCGKVIIIYSPGMARRRVVILPDEDAHIPLHVANLKRGEQVFIGCRAMYNLIGPDAMLERVLGKPPVKDRCALVDSTGMVVGAINADPVIDFHDLPLWHTLRHDPDSIAEHGNYVHRLALK